MGKLAPIILAILLFCPHARANSGTDMPAAADTVADEKKRSGLSRLIQNTISAPKRDRQAELEAAEYTGSASGEMVTVRMNGKHEILGITIKPEAVDPDDVEMLEDMVAAAINATVKQVDETAEAEMGKLTGGLNIPGL